MSPNQPRQPQPAEEPARPPSAAALRARFDEAEPFTVGIEDELMLLDPDSYELTPRGQRVLGLLDGDERFKLELPASQLEIVTSAAQRVPELARELLTARRELAARTAGIVRLAVAGAHPFSPGLGDLNQLPGYAHTISEYGLLAQRQLVCALQVHVSVGEAEPALAVYNAARSYLPLLAALAANAPFYEGRDSGLASVRPKLSGLLPRQGVPPAFESWEAYAHALRWGAESRAFSDARTWWWELRLHRRYGTLEFRVPDGQSTVADAATMAAVIQALVAWLTRRHGAGERLPVAATWRIEENRWSACRHGVEGSIADLETGRPRPTGECLDALLDELASVAEGLGSAALLARGRALARHNGALAQRAIAADGGPRAVAPWLVERFLDPWPG